MLCFRLLYAIVLTSVVYDVCVCVCVCVCVRACVRACVVIVHCHCSAQLSMFNMEKRYTNKIIIIIIIIIVALAAGLLTQFFPCCAFAIRSFSKVSATPDLCKTATAQRVFRLTWQEEGRCWGCMMG